MDKPSVPPAPRSRRGLVLVVVASVVGVALGLLLAPRGPRVDPAEPPPLVVLLGAELPTGEGAVRAALDRVRKHVAGPFELELPDGVKRRTTFGRLGVQIDRVRLGELVRATRDPSSALRRELARRGARRVELPLPVV
ncbi:MAG: hypothetical protein FJ104_17740, partial [Deltaproteobacteria bacterium]|nr:hypothetical protein [Deltaproteobacteria bacterium]